MSEAKKTSHQNIDAGSKSLLRIEDLEFSALLQSQPEDGRLFFNQRRAVIFDVNALGALRQQLITTLGEELAAGVLARFGYSHGHSDAETLGERFEWETEEDWLAAGPFLHMLEGVVQVDPQKIEFDRTTGQFHMQGIWRHSYEAEEHLKRYGSSDTPVCWTLTGYASGYASRFFGGDLLAIETACVGKGDDHCRWEIRPVAEWGDEATPYLESLQQIDVAAQLFDTNRRLQLQAQRLTLLNEMAAELNQAATLEEICKIAAVKTSLIVDSDRISLALQTLTDDAVEVLALDGLQGAISVGAQLPVVGTAVGEVIRTSKPLIFDDIRGEEYLEFPELAKQGLRAVMSVPLTTKDQVIGALNLGSKTVGAYDAARDESLVLQIASLLASAIENRRLLSQIQESEAANRALLEAIPDLLVRLHRDGTYLDVRAAKEVSTRIPAAEMIGKSVSDVLPEQVAEQLMQAVEQTLRRKETQTLEYQLFIAGELRYREARAVVSGKDEVMLLMRDITERKQAEEALRTSQARLSEALELARLAYWEFEVKTQTFTFNDQAYDLFRTTADREGGYQMSVADFTQKFVRSDNAAQVGFHIQQALETEDPHFFTQFETPMRWRDGTDGYIAVQIRVVKDEQGRTIKLYGTNQDITAQKQAEETLAKRAAELETVAQVSTAASTLLDVEKLLQEVVDLTKERFDLYHTHIYLLNQAGDTLKLAAGAGEVGRQMVSKGWSIPVQREQSLVARAVRMQQGVIVNNVREDPGWLPNPLLPDTRSEMAIPMIVGDRVLGVLDVQSSKADRFTEEDVRIKTTLAVQIAVALENARLFEETQQASFLLGERVKELHALNELGREMEEAPSVPELLQWTAERMPPAMQYPELCRVAIEHQGQVYGQSEAMKLPTQMTHGLYIRGNIEGRIYVAYTEKHDFLNEESALLGGMANRVSGYIENRRLFEQAQARARQEQLLREVADRVRGAADVDTVMRTAAQEVGRVLGRPVYVRLGNGGHPENQYPADDENSSSK